ncbi:N-acyl-D-amino-acid deacylase family protein [Pseudoxanthomonas dokdonensis]|uniref:D-aminoacylase n=1 Tax=Pseudoxanthomonas dokdonensis TaxID=344882 RepID=A0A0R0CPX9_9GAMM|nr:D-aminoacylase [Pseudoxanthomonas dokdonensis]KRG67572.1 D-aminoacylase [Pseudoxanthomonas dokdonensis]
MLDLLIRGARVIDGSGSAAFDADIGVREGRIAALGALDLPARQYFDAAGAVVCPGFIDVHTHDDLQVIRHPRMLSKLSQGVTTVVVGNCGISASPVLARNNLPDPMNLLGDEHEFRYPDFASYRTAVEAAAPAVNVAALVGHTSLRANHMDRLDRAADGDEIEAMRLQLRQALQQGALGLSSGLAYGSAWHAPNAEVLALAAELPAGGSYASHLRDEFAGVLDALDEAFAVGQHSGAAVRISHLKCAGVDNWGRSARVLEHLQAHAQDHDVACDCYPYAASASTLDLKQVTDAYDILITWSQPEPGQGGRLLAEIAADWQLPLLEAARRLQPAGAVYHCMDEADVQRILAHPLTMIGSDGLPRDPRPHPRLWGTFPRVLGHYVREQKLFPLHEAVRKMTGLPAQRFQLGARGRVRIGGWADLVCFDPESIRDTADFHDPCQPAAGIRAVWVNGQLAYDGQDPAPTRHGRFITPDPTPAALA